jgi:hypothetical protein
MELTLEQVLDAKYVLNQSEDWQLGNVPEKMRPSVVKYCPPIDDEWYEIVPLTQEQLDWTQPGYIDKNSSKYYANYVCYSKTVIILDLKANRLISVIVILTIEIVKDKSVLLRSDMAYDNYKYQSDPRNLISEYDYKRTIDCHGGKCRLDEPAGVYCTACNGNLDEKPITDLLPRSIAYDRLKKYVIPELSQMQVESMLDLNILTYDQLAAVTGYLYNLRKQMSENLDRYKMLIAQAEISLKETDSITSSLTIRKSEHDSTIEAAKQAELKRQEREMLEQQAKEKERIRSDLLAQQAALAAKLQALDS